MSERLGWLGPGLFFLPRDSVYAYNDPAVLLPMQSLLYEDAAALRKNIVKELSSLEDETSKEAFGGTI